MRVAVTDRLGRTVAVLTGSRLAVAGATVGAVLLMSAAIMVAAHRTPAWPGLILLSVALLALADSDSGLGLGLVLFYGVWWLLAVPAEWSSALWALLAATGVLVLHLALAHEASGPGGVTAAHTALGSLWSGGLLVLLATAALTGVVVLADDRWDTPTWLVGLAVALLAVLPWLAHADLPPPADDE